MVSTAMALAAALLVSAASPGAGWALAPDPLIDAVKAGDVAAVRSALRGGANPNAAQGDGLSALHIAAQEGSLEIVGLLLDAKADVHARTTIGGYTPLHLAAGAAQAQVVGRLIDAGADAGATTSSTGVTPLHLAAKALGGEEAVRVLIEKGAPVNAAETAAGQTALMFAAAAGRPAAVRVLLEGGADPSARTKVVDLLERTVVDREAQDRLREALREMRGDQDRPLTFEEEQAAIRKQREFLTNAQARAEALDGFTPSQLEGTGSYYRGGPEFVSKPTTQTLVRKTGGLSALHHAARAGNIEATKALLDGGAPIDLRSGDGSTPLVISLLNGQFDLAMELIERGADPSIATETDGVGPLFATLQTRWAFKFTYQPQPRAQDAAETDHMAVLKALLDAGADPNQRLTQHLWHFEWEGKTGLDITGATPFWRAAFARDTEAMKLLASYGADPNIPTAFGPVGLRPRRQPDGRQQEDSGLPLIPEGTPNMYPIHAAAGGGYLGLAAFQQNDVPNGFLNAVSYLVDEHGADVNLKDAWGYTPLHYAAVRGGNDLIEYLVEKGADVTIPSRLGQSPVDMARGGQGGFFLRTPYPKTVELLQSLGSPFLCLATHFRDTGDFCPGAGAEPFEGALVTEDAAAAGRPTF
jgi:ankyrin repeat protein